MPGDRDRRSSQPPPERPEAKPGSPAEERPGKQAPRDGRDTSDDRDTPDYIIVGSEPP